VEDGGMGAVIISPPRKGQRIRRGKVNTLAAAVEKQVAFSSNESK